MLSKLKIRFRTYGNQITGPFPTEIGSLTGMSAKLDANSNEYTSTIPTEIGRLTKMETYMVSKCAHPQPPEPLNHAPPPRGALYSCTPHKSLHEYSLRLSL